MQQTLIGMHSLWRWVVLLLVVVALLRGVVGWLRGGEWTSLDRQLSMLAVTAIDIQVLLGIILFISEQRWTSTVFFSAIHPFAGLAALAAAHIGNARVKRATTSQAKYRRLTISLFVALLLMTAVIPSYAWYRAWPV